MAAQESPASPPPFQYDPLPDPSHIRLLEKLDADDDGTLRFSLSPYDLSSADHQRKAYHCLSYTWGNPFAHGGPFREHFTAIDAQYSPANKVLVLINEQPMRIQKNLHDALSTVPPERSYIDYVNNPPGDATGGQTYLHIAAGRGRATNVETWLRQGADIDGVDDHGHNAMHFAAGNGKVECVRVLLRHGCRTDIRDADGQTPLDLARSAGHREVVAFLEEEASPSRQDPTPASDRPRTFIWADAICINQNDTEEKSSQVTMMDRIYSAATYVAAWLGPADTYTDTGIQTLKTLRTNLKKFKESQIQPFSGLDKSKYADAGIPYISRDEWTALASIYQRQWFRRAWIVQEAILPSSLLMYIGATTVIWHHLGQVSDAIQHQEARLGTTSSTGFTPSTDVAVPVVLNMALVSEWRQLKASMNNSGDSKNTDASVQRTPSPFEPRHLVDEFWTFLASDPRDKVFATYGLLNLSSPERRQADYGLSVEAVYTMAARELIASENNLRTLSRCVAPLQRRSGLPSWVPDFSLQGTNSISSNFSADKGLEYIPPRPAADSACPILSVRGALIGKISQVGGRPGTGVGEKLRLDPTWLSMLISLRGKGGYGENPSLSCILWTTLCMNLSSGSMFNPKLYGDTAPDIHGFGFKYFFLLLLLAAGDSKIRERLGLEASTTEPSLIFSHQLDYDPMVAGGDMEPVLADLDALHEHDGDQCWLPSREEVLRFWNNYTYNLIRNTSVDEDGGPSDFYLPEGVTQDNSRPIGNGFANMHSRIGVKCLPFFTAYSAVYGGRQLVTANDMYLGMAPLTARPGDEVWVLPGGNAPAVLRSVQAGGLVKEGSQGEGDAKRYQLVGSCYISGMMHGEITEFVKARLEDIELI
jgi:hypothetical protein